MRERQGLPDEDRGQARFAIAMAGILGQAGCVTLLFIGAGLGLGLWLDARFDTRPIFTLLFVLGSVPVTMYLLFRMVMTNTRRLQRLSEQGWPRREDQEEVSGTDA